MSTQHTATVYITNNSGGNAIIQMSHRHASDPAETWLWNNVAPGASAGPMLVHFDTGFGTGLDYWWVGITVIDGPNSGIYASIGSLSAPGKECEMQSKDANQTIYNTVDTTEFKINLTSGGCPTAMSLIAPYAPISHVFVFMLENHSFDHLLGFSGITGTDAVTGQPTQINGLTGKETNSYNGSTYTVTSPAIDPMPYDPGHNFSDVLEELCGQGTLNPFPPANPQPDPTVAYPPINNSGFVADYAGLSKHAKPSDIMACCNSSVQVPTLYQLAKEFMVCDNWFSSLPGPTWPNRFFAMAASSAGLDDAPSGGQIIHWIKPSNGVAFPNGSIFQQLTNYGHSWRIYNDNLDQFTKYPPWGGFGAIPVVLGLSGIKLGDINSFSHFASDLEGSYPYQFTFIEPNYGDDVIFSTYRGGSSQHPMDVLGAGDDMLAAVYNAIRNSALWPTSLLIVTYDEHGGFYDHVTPPTSIPPGDNPSNGLNVNGFNFSQYGTRVPAVVVSPQLPQNSIDHTLYDHSSIPKTLEDLFQFPPLTQRDANANSLVSVLGLGNVRHDCPVMIAPSSTPKAQVAPVALTAAEQQAIDSEPMPEKGNVWGFLQIALKTDIEISGGGEELFNEKIEQFKAIKTVGDARNYMADVFAKIQAAKSSKNT